MTLFLDILSLCAGIGLFLFAMYLIEESLKNLAGRNFKLFLRNSTKNRIGAVTGGAVVTGILQSSSMVSLMVLAFVGAGVFTMRNAMAIILGANLGTTLDSWVVATLGFKVNTEVLAYPLALLGGLLLILLGSRKKIKYLSYFLLGFSLLFIGLSFMKTAMEGQVKHFDLTPYAGMSTIVFLVIGFVTTLLVQSSSVTMALTLSAVHAQAIGFLPAAAIVLGSETGTTIKLLLSAIGGTASKKRVVLGNLLFNIFLTIAAFVLLKPILSLITNVFHISDPLIGLVTFSSLVNLCSIFVFLPFLDLFTRFLERFFNETDESTAAYISHADLEDPQTALELFRKEADYFIYNCILFNRKQFGIEEPDNDDEMNFKHFNKKRKTHSKTPEESYEFIRQLQGEIQSFYLKLRSRSEDEESVELGQLIAAVRSSMYSVKSIKDISSNMNNLSRSSKDIKYGLFTYHKKETEKLYTELQIQMKNPGKDKFEKLQGLYDNIQNSFSSALRNFYKDALGAPIDEMDMTIAIDFNRELFTSNKAMLMAVKDFILDEREAAVFNEVPVYKT